MILYRTRSVRIKQNLDSSKLKEFASDIFKFNENGRKLSRHVEDTVAKGEIARYEQFLLFPQGFRKTCNADTYKPGLVWERVKMVTYSKSDSWSAGLCLARNPGVVCSSRTGSFGLFMGASLCKALQRHSQVLVKPRKDMINVSCCRDMTGIMLKVALNIRSSFF